MDKSWLWLTGLTLLCMVFRGPFQKKAAEAWDVGKVGMFAAAVSFAVWCVVAALDKGERRPGGSAAMWWSAGAGVVSTVGAAAMLNAFRRAPVASINAVLASHVVLVMLSAWAVAGERPTLAQAGGAALVFCGVVLVASGR